MNHYIFAGLYAVSRVGYLKNNNITTIVTDEDIIEYAQELCELMNVSFQAILGTSRKQEYSHPRHIVFFRIKNRWKLKVSLKRIGQLFSGRDHSTVLSSIQVCEDLLLTDGHFRYLYQLSEGKHPKYKTKEYGYSPKKIRTEKPHKPIPELIGNKYLTN